MPTKIKTARTRLITLDRDVLPHALQASPPRDVVLSLAGWVIAACGLALLLGGIVGGLVLADHLKADAADANELRASGIATDAVVTRTRRSGGDSPRLNVFYEFTVDGRHFENRAQLRKRNPLASTIQPGSRVRVVYLPSQPGKSWLEGAGPRENPVWVAAIVPALAIPGALLIALVLHRQRRLLEEGRAAMARITSAEKKSKGENVWRIAYTWRLLNGAERTAYADRSSPPPSGTGSYLPILYDRENPARYSLWPLSLVKLRSPL